MLKRARAKLFARSKAGEDREYSVGGISLVLPGDHRLPAYQKSFRLYDRKVGWVARAVTAVHPQAVGIDVGANVGDSAAMIRSCSPMPLICIEGDPVYFEYLQQNAKSIGGIRCLNRLVGAETGSVCGQLARHGGTGGLASAAGSLQIESLPDIVHRAGIDPATVGLIKTDTDGSDFDILIGSGPLITQVLPTLFFEYLVVDAASAHRAAAAVELLAAAGYRFVVFDNYGHTMRTVRDGARCTFRELSDYLLSGITCGGGIPYLDVFATTEDAVLEGFLTLEAGFLESQTQRSPAVEH